MKILDSLVEWVAEQIMNFLDLINISILGTLGTDMTTFNSFFPAAETFYKVFVWIGVGFILLSLVWGLYKNFGLGIGIEAEEPIKLVIKSSMFILLTVYSSDIMDLVLKIGGTPMSWILEENLPPIEFANFNSVLLTVIGGIASGSVALIVLVIVVVLAWNYLKLLLESAERYIVLAVLIYTAPMAFACGPSQSTNNVFKSWCKMVGGQMFLLVMNAWCLRLITSMVGNFIANPLALGEGSAGVFIWFLCALGFLKVSTKIDSIMASLGLNTARTGGNLLGDLMLAAKTVGKATGGSSSSSKGSSSSGSSDSQANSLSGGLAGIVGRKLNDFATKSATGEGSGISGMIGKALMEQSRVGSGDFANDVVGQVASGKKSGNISGESASSMLSSYLGHDQNSPLSNIPGSSDNNQNDDLGLEAQTSDNISIPSSEDYDSGLSLDSLETSDSASIPTSGDYNTELDSTENLGTGNMQDSSGYVGDVSSLGSIETSNISSLGSYESSNIDGLGDSGINDIDSLGTNLQDSPVALSGYESMGMAEFPSYDLSFDAINSEDESDMNALGSSQSSTQDGSPIASSQSSTQDNSSFSVDSLGTGSEVTSAKSKESISSDSSSSVSSPNISSSLSGSRPIDSSPSKSQGSISSDSSSVSSPNVSSSSSGSVPSGSSPSKSQGNISSDSSSVSSQTITSTQSAGVSISSGQEISSGKESQTIISEGGMNSISPTENISISTGVDAPQIDNSSANISGLDENRSSASLNSNDVSSLGLTNVESSSISTIGSDFVPEFSNVEMGNGRITGIEKNEDNPTGIEFAMYSVDKYIKPTGGHELVKSEDGANWYKQYAQNVVKSNPTVDMKTGEINYNKEVIKELPKIPAQKDRV